MFIGVEGVSKYRNEASVSPSFCMRAPPRGDVALHDAQERCAKFSRAERVGARHGRSEGRVHLSRAWEGRTAPMPDHPGSRLQALRQRAKTSRMRLRSRELLVSRGEFRPSRCDDRSSLWPTRAPAWSMGATAAPITPASRSIASTTAPQRTQDSSYELTP